MNSFNQSTNPENASKYPAIDTVEDLITLVEGPAYETLAPYPVKLDTVIAIICDKGSVSGTLNLKQFAAKAPCLFIVLSGQILQCDNFSKDFIGYAIIMSKEFWNGFKLDSNVAFPLFSSIRENPSIPLKKEDLDSMKDYFRLLQKTVRNPGNEGRSEAVKHLTLAFFYGFGYQYHRLPENLNKSKKDKLVEKFLVHVRENFKGHRDVDFYADKLFLTPKYLSKALKQASGKTAAGWIADHVILEAKALLKSTNLTVQQISDELSFPSQSFFGKYFKRRTGYSPKEYRKA